MTDRLKLLGDIAGAIDEIVYPRRPRRRREVVGRVTKAAGTFLCVDEQNEYTKWVCHLCGRTEAVAPARAEPALPCPCQEGAPPPEVCHEFEGAAMRILTICMRDRGSPWMRLLGHFPPNVDGDMAREAKMLRARADALWRLYDERAIPAPRLP